jgi:hypothetical protein
MVELFCCDKNNCNYFARMKMEQPALDEYSLSVYFKMIEDYSKVV